MSRPLPRYLEPEDFQRKLARILIETGDAAPTTTVVKATLAGDNRRLRGIPAIGYSVAGVSPGTDPVAELLRNNRANR